MCAGTVSCWVVSAPTFKIMALCALKTLSETHTRFNQDSSQNHRMHRVIQWLRAQYAQKRKKEKQRLSSHLCVK